MTRSRGGEERKKGDKQTVGKGYDAGQRRGKEMNGTIETGVEEQRRVKEMSEWTERKDTRAEERGRYEEAK